MHCINGLFSLTIEQNVQSVTLVYLCVGLLTLTAKKFMQSCAFVYLFIYKQKVVNGSGPKFLGRQILASRPEECCLWMTSKGQIFYLLNVCSCHLTQS